MKLRLLALSISALCASAAQNAFAQQTQQAQQPQSAQQVGLGQSCTLQQCSCAESSPSYAGFGRLAERYRANMRASRQDDSLDPFSFKLSAPVHGKNEGMTVTALDGTGQDEKFAAVEGQVDMRSPSRHVLADWAYFDIAEDLIKAKGNVAIRSWQDLVIGPELEYKRDTATGFMKQPEFVLGAYKGRGKADELQFLGPQQYRVIRGSYSTCADDNPAWHLESGSLDIDEAKGVGTSKDTKIYLGTLPIAWFPEFSFPLKNERKSGVLAPTYGFSGTRGLDFQIPYYINLAPNYDATVTPRVMTKRGILLGGETRYMFDTEFGKASGIWSGEILPHDQVSNSTRDAVNIHHTQIFSPNLSVNVNYSHVSDYKYFVDLSDFVAITSTTTLPRDVTLSYRLNDWALTAKAQRFQTLQDPAAPVLPPYDRTPQLTAVSPLYRFGENNRFEARNTTDFTRFLMPTSSLYDTSRSPSGYRTYNYSSLLYRYDTDAFFLIPKIGLHASDYRLSGDYTGYANTTRVLPITSIDTGFRLERDASVFGQAFNQTLEPRAMLTYIPYKDQSKIPVFDSALADLNYTQLFSENRYIGNDRIGDTTQIALGATTRYFDPESQKERMRFTIGERFYFNQQKVTIGESVRNRNSSDILFSAEGRVTDALYVQGSTQFNAAEGQTERYALGLRYSPERAKNVNVNYRAIRELATSSGAVNVKQIDVSGQWPIFKNIYAVGRVNYSIADRKVTESVIGLEYDGCCYVVRAVAQRLTTGTNTATNSVFLQLELNGLGRIGSSPLDVLKRNIPGYTQLYQNPLSRRADGSGGDAEPSFSPWNP